jgi:hypothetical protein
MPLEPYLTDAQSYIGKFGGKTILENHVQDVEMWLKKCSQGSKWETEHRELCKLSYIV